MLVLVHVFCGRVESGRRGEGAPSCDWKYDARANID